MGGCTSSKKNNKISKKMEKEAPPLQEQEENPPDFAEEELGPYENEDDPENFVAPKTGFPPLPENYTALIDKEFGKKKYNLIKSRKKKNWTWTKTTEDGGHFEGVVKNGKLNGVGRIYNKDGNYKHGRFENGELVDGIWIKPDGTSLAGKFDADGNLIL